MTEKYELTTWDDGRQVRVYESGLVRDEATGYIVRPAPGTVITAETSPALHRARKQKTAALLRERITEETQGRSPRSVTNAPEAVAEAGAMIWVGTVLNTDAHPRDRLEAWREISRAAEVLSDGRDREPDDDTDTGIVAAVGRENLRAWLDERERVRRSADGSASAPVVSRRSVARSAGADRLPSAVTGSASGAGQEREE